MSMQAIWAFEKLVLGTPSAEATGVITPELWDRMQDPLEAEFAPRRPQGQGINHVEIYLPEQAMIVYHSDQPALITHISSGELDENGEPKKYCETITIESTSTSRRRLCARLFWSTRRKSSAAVATLTVSPTR